MKNLIVLAVACVFATTATAAEMKWSGSAGWRYTSTKNDDNLGSRNQAGATTAQNSKDESVLRTKAHQVRANLGATGGWENVEWGAGVRTTSAANSDWAAAGGNGSDKTIGLDQAWFRYLKDFGGLDFNVTVGRQMNVFAYDHNSQNFFDNDVRWDGFGWQFKFGMFGFNAGQYLLGAYSSQAGANAANASYGKTEASDAIVTTSGTKSHFNAMYGFQPHVNFKFSDEIETMLAVGYYLTNDSSQTNRTGGGFDNSSGRNANASGNTVPAVNSATVKVTNLRQLQVFNTWTLPMNLSASWEYVKNHKMQFGNATVTAWTPGQREVDMSTAAWAAGLKYGNVKKAHDFSVSYYYGNKGLGSVLNTYTNNQFMADNKGHTLAAAYALADNFTVGARGLWLKEKEKKVATTGLAYSGTQAAQDMATSFWELTAGVSF